VKSGRSVPAGRATVSKDLHMNRLIATLMTATALIAPTVAMARDVTITTTMTNYRGNAAYLAIYLTNPDGSYASTLWVAGGKQRYYGDLRGWVRSLQTAKSLNLDGITGASVGSGRTLTIHANVADALIDAGYTVHVESAVEEGGNYPDDAVVPLSASAPVVAGTGYVSTLALSM
jgi:hypothetical protein